LERSKLLLWGLVVVAAGVIIWRVGFLTPNSYVPSADRQADTKSGPVVRAASVPVGDASAGAGAGKPADTKAPSEPNKPAAGTEPNKPVAGAEPNKPAGATEPNRPADSAKAAEPNKPSSPSDAAKAKAAEPNAPKESGEPMEAVNLKDVEMKSIIDKIAQWTGKTVIPHDEAMKQKVTIYAPFA